MTTESNAKIEIIEVGPCLGESAEGEYEAECSKLEACYTELEAGTPYLVYVRPCRKGEAPGTYMRNHNGLQILGYSLEVPEDLQILQTLAFEKFCQG